MRALLAASLLLLTPAVLSAQAATFDIEGVVIDDQSGQPLADADVFLLGTDHTTRTTASGRFRLPGIPRGGYLVAVRRIGYALSYLGVDGSQGGRVNAEIAVEPDAQALPDLVATATLPGLHGDLDRRIREGKSVIVPARELWAWPTLADGLRFIRLQGFAAAGRPRSVGLTGRGCVLWGLNGILQPVRNIGQSFARGFEGEAPARTGASFVGASGGSRGGRGSPATATEFVGALHPSMFEAVEIVMPQFAPDEYGGQVPLGCAVVQVWQ